MPGSLPQFLVPYPPPPPSCLRLSTKAVNRSAKLEPGISARIVRRLVFMRAHLAIAAGDAVPLRRRPGQRLRVVRGALDARRVVGRAAALGVVPGPAEGAQRLRRDA